MVKYSMKVFVLIMLLGIISIAGCSDSNKLDTYIKLDVGGENYEFNYIEFLIVKHGRNDLFYISIGGDLIHTNMNDVPSGGLYFDVSFKDKKELLYDSIYFNEQRDKNLRANAEFTITQDLSMIPDYKTVSDSTTTLNITKIRDGYVEGEFEGIDWILISKTLSPSKIVDVSGKFRAKLIEQKF